MADRSPRRATSARATGMRTCDGIRAARCSRSVGGAGLTVKSYQDLICVNQFGKRFWNELDDTYGFLNACLGRHDPDAKSQQVERRRSHLGDLRRRLGHDAEEWDPKPPNVDPNGWFFSGRHDRASSRARSRNPYQLAPMPARQPRGRPSPNTTRMSMRARIRSSAGPA